MTGAGGWHLRLRNLSITAKLSAIVLVFVVVIAALTGVIAGALSITNGVRAYVHGEGLWSKAQKDAVHYLTRYAHLRQEADYENFVRAIALPVATRDSRLELQKPGDFDRDIVARGFVGLGIVPDDVPPMIFLFRWFHDVSFFANAISTWTEADGYIGQLVKCGEEVRAVVVAGRLTAQEETRLLARIEILNARLTSLEHEFSTTLDEGSRWIYHRLVLAAIFVALLLLASALWVAGALSQAVRAGIQDLRQGAMRVSAGDLEHPIAVRSADELGELAEVFNEMIGHRKQAEDSLERDREFLTILLENLSEGIVACNESGTLTLFNRATREFHGLPEAPLPPESWAQHYDLFYADGVTRMRTEDVPLYRAFQGERIKDLEMVIAPKSAPRRVLVVNGAPMVTSTGRKLGAVIALHDVTARRRAEEELMSRAEELARSNTELEQFAYVASHDLQEPLRTVASYTQLLAREFAEKGGPHTDEYVAYVVDGVQRMRDLIQGLLAYSRVSRQDQPHEQADMQDLLDAALANLADVIRSGGAVVTHGDLPRLRVNPPLIVQLFQNLVGNALKFRGADAVRVHVSAERKGNMWQFSVRDNGIGIEPRYFERIFALFQRLHTRDVYPGSGIGLALCRKIVERHKGRIWVEEGRPGSVFHFTLPA